MIAAESDPPVIEEPGVLETIESPTRHRSPGIPWLDIALGISVLAVSIGSLLVSQDSSRTMESLVEQNRRLVLAGSTPLLQFEHGNADDDGTSEISLAVSNFGTGPARIVWFELRHEDQLLKDGAALLNRMAPVGRAETQIVSSPISGTLMRTGETRRIFGWKPPQETQTQALAKWTTLNRERFKLTAQACYCSLFDECWTSSLGVSTPKPVTTCGVEGRTPYFG